MADDQPVVLKRSLGFWALLAYGVGDILGAGIYALIGKVAGAAGPAAWMSFGVAMLVASLTGLTYAELVSRHPISAGEAHFCRLAFRRSSIAQFIGWLVFCSGVVSLATVTHAFSGYLHELRPTIPTAVLWLGFLLALAGICFWGIRESSNANIVFTVIEITGLLLVLIAGAVYLTGDHIPAAAAVPKASFTWLGVAQGATLAFFAFIGFEDMINVAEEVREPRRVFPPAIIWAVLITGGVYMAIAMIATAVVPPQQLAASQAPLLHVVEIAAPAIPSRLYTLIALCAVTNTGLLNFVMASRLVYGMSKRGLLPRWAAAVHPRRNTPHRAILLVVLFAAGMVFSGTLTLLAATTSALLLSVFFAVNLSLIFIRLREAGRPSGFYVPVFVPIAGALTCIALAGFVELHSWLRAVGVSAVGLLLIGIDALRRSGDSAFVGDGTGTY